MTEAGVRAQVIARIRKLRERGDYRGDDVNFAAEATNARRLARELMEQHGITAADLKPPRPSRPLERPVPRRAGVPVRLDLNFGPIRIHWSGNL